MSATACGVAALVTMIGEVAEKLLGVPLPVILTAGAGAWFARARAPAGPGFLRDLGETCGYWFFAAVLPPLAAWTLEALTGAKVPVNAQAGLACVLGWALPKVAPIVEEKLPALVRAWFDRNTKGGGNG